jgi:arylsulfatase A-like enzyme
MLGAYGNKEVRTPNIDRLSMTGTRFQNHFAAAPEPALGRTTLLTGRTPMQIGDSGAPAAADISVDKVLSGAGYACHSAEGTSAEEATSAAVKFLDQQAAGKNFLLTVRYSLHAPYDVPQKFAEMYASQPFESYAADKPAPNAAEDREMLGAVVPSLRKAAGAISYVDDQIGAVLARLSQKQLADGTLVVFTSTCGANFGRHGLWGSGLGSNPPNMFDEVVNTPMIWVWPTRIPPQGVQVELVSAYDFLPTLCDFAALEPPARNLCGRSYLLLATGKKMPKKQPWRTTVCANLRNTDMAREERFKVVLRDGGKGPNELYDLTSDRVERVNQYQAPEYTDVKNRLSAEITKWKGKYSA